MEITAENRGELERIREVPEKSLSRRNIPFSTCETFIDEPRARASAYEKSLSDTRVQYIYYEAMWNGEIHDDVLSYRLFPREFPPKFMFVRVPLRNIRNVTK